MIQLLLQITERIEPVGHFHDELILPFDQRQKSRARVTLKSGIEAALILERGTILRGGDFLRSGDGRIIKVIAASEAVMKVTPHNPLHAGGAQQLLRAVYHLANRHVPLQIGDGWLRLEQDHVLKAMLSGLSMLVKEELAPFEPEAGAYGGGHHHHHEH